MKIITFSGRAGAGKNFTASIVEELLNGDTHELAYGNAVKSVALSMGWDGVKDAKGRKLLQSIGEAGRQYNPDIWVNKVIDCIKLINGYNKDAVVCITDARFPPNEIVNLQREFGKENVLTLKILGRKADMGELENDISETSMDDFEYDFYIDNSSTPEKLKANIEVILNEEGLI